MGSNGAYEKLNEEKAADSNIKRLTSIKQDILLLGVLWEPHGSILPPSSSQKEPENTPRRCAYPHGNTAAGFTGIFT